MNEQANELSEFLLSRIAEDEQDAIDAMNTSAIQGESVSLLTTLVLSDCEAKRRIVEMDAVDPYLVPTRVLAYLALSYADHPDYRQEWKP